jgi:hypothetical protein
MVLDLLVELYCKEYSLPPLLIIDLRKLLIDHMLFLFRCGYSLPVLNFIAERQSDQSLIVYFLQNVLKIIRSPVPIQETLLKILEKIKGNDHYEYFKERICK